MVSKEACKEWSKKYVPMITIITVFLVGGTGSTIMPKTAYQTEAEGKDGDVHYFLKPLFLNWCMFLGMTLCLFIYFFEYIILPCFKKTKKDEPVLDIDEPVEGEKKLMTWKGYLLMLIPALCDFLATYLMNFALIVVSSSIFQMMKGSIILFTAILAVIYRKQKLFGYEITGVVVIIISLVVIGSATLCPSYQDTADSSLAGSTTEETSVGSTLVGILLIFIGMFLQALQTIIEEQALHDISAPVSFVVGLEGIYGLILCSCMMPIMGMDWVPADLYEDTKDTFIMLGNNPTLIGIIVVHVCFVFMFNLTGMMITDYVNAMVRNIMEPLRMITIWITSVFLYYVIDESIGEKVGLFTILEIIGFILLAFGFLLYTKVIKIPKVFKYQVNDEYQQFDDDDFVDEK